MMHTVNRLNVDKQKGIAHVLVLVILVITSISILGMYLYSRTVPRSNFVLGSKTEENRSFVKNDTRACNAFNIRTVENYNGLTFHQSLNSAISTILNYANEPSSVLVNRYGPWCDNEAHPAGSRPFARNLVSVVDKYAMFGAGRYKVLSGGNWSAFRCRSPLPPALPREGDRGVTCSAFSIRAAPGDPYFDYYRGVLTKKPGACTFKTHGYPYVAHPDRIISEFIADNPKYLGNVFNDQLANDELFNIRQLQLEHLVWTAYERNVNPYLLIGLWATESGWSNRSSCYTQTSSGFTPPSNIPFNVWAKGTQNNGVYPIMVLKVKNVEVARWTVTSTLTQYSTKISTRDPREISVHFVNDGGPRDLNVDYIQIDGDVYHSNAKNIYATGVWRSETGCSSGYFEQEWLNCNGYFRFNEH